METAGVLGDHCLVFPDVKFDKWPSSLSRTSDEPDIPSGYCNTCSTTGFTTEPDVSYEDLNFILPNYKDYSHEKCIEKCQKTTGCNTYRWQTTTAGVNECYLIEKTGKRRTDGNGISGRACLGHTECSQFSQQILAILSNKQTIGWTIKQNCK